ncbi:MAG: aromatic ring-hydroxylating dioxygenase subunit alpha [Polyangiaceae bacterium]
MSALFPNFGGVWTPVAFGAHLRKDEARRVVVAGTELVLFRDESGTARALLDRCPHRGVALSLGTVRDGRIECPFHGWTFDGQGRACHVPWNPDAKRDRLGARSVPTRELAGHVFVHTAPEDPGVDPFVPDVLVKPGVRVSGFEVVWNVHWTRAMENMLDSPHLPFVHRATIGRRMRSRVQGRMDIDHEETPWGAIQHIRIDGEPQPGRLDFVFPNRMVLHIPVPGRVFVMMVTCVPESGTRTRMVLTTARDFLTWPVLDFVFHRTNARIAREDKAILESCPGEVPPAGEEKSVRTDAPTLHFRKRYFAELRTDPPDGSPLGPRARLPVVHAA